MVNNTKLLELLNNYKLEDLKQALTDNIREDAAKSTGKKSYLSIITKIIKDAAPSFKSAAVYGNKFAFTNGHYVIFSDSDFGYEHNDWDVSKLEPTESLDDTITFNIDDVKAQIAFNKANSKKRYPDPVIVTLASGVKVGVNPSYILNIYNFTGSTTFAFNCKTGLGRNCNINPLFQLDDDGKMLAVVLPVHVG